MDQKSLFLNHVAQTSEHPMMLEIARAEGMFLYTTSDIPIMDLICGISVSILGHCHPLIVSAVQDQAAKYMHTMVYGEFILEPQVELSTKLSDILPPELESVNLTNSGAEAVEGAIKLAKKATGRYDVVACHRSYHGTTHGTACLMSDPVFTKPYRPLVPNVRFIHFNKVEDLVTINDQTACVVMETVQAARGLYVPQDDYLKKVKTRCKEVGALLILDEIQAGYGRTGKMFAFEAFGIVPDILCIAKGMGGGMPIAAFIASKDMMMLLARDPMLGHISTFGGHPVNCAAALATLGVLTSTNLIDDVSKKAEVFLKRLPHPQIIEIRHCGLWFALQMRDQKTMHRAVALALEAGMLIDWFLFNDRCIRLAPPLIITMEQIEWACKKLHQVFDQL